MRSVPEGEQLYDILTGLSGPIGNVDPAFDRTAAIMGATYLEHALKKAISTHLKSNSEDPDFDRVFYSDGAPLWEFSGRIRMAHGLGIIDAREYQSLEHIRLIRNAFAHTMTHISFDTPEIASQCKELIITDEPTFKTLDAIFASGGAVYDLLGAYHRRVYVHAVFILFWKLINYPPLSHQSMLARALAEWSPSDGDEDDPDEDEGIELPLQ